MNTPFTLLIDIVKSRITNTFENDWKSQHKKILKNIKIDYIFTYGSIFLFLLSFCIISLLNIPSIIFISIIFILSFLFLSILKLIDENEKLKNLKKHYNFSFLSMEFLNSNIISKKFNFVLNDDEMKELLKISLPISCKKFLINCLKTKKNLDLKELIELEKNYSWNIYLNEDTNNLFNEQQLNLYQKL